MTTTIAIQPLSRPITLTGELIQLQVILSPQDFLGVFDRLEVWRSRVTDAGPYDELTGPQVSGARIPKGAPDQPSTPVTGTSVVISGMSLNLLVDERIPVDITFSGPDPVTYASAAAQISAQGQGRVTSYVDATGGMVIETTTLSTSTSLRVLGGDAAPQLALPIGEPEGLAFGREAWIPLVLEQSDYRFVDYFGSPLFFYKVRSRNSSTGAVSEFSASFSGPSRLGVDPQQVIEGRARLVQFSGRPLVNQEVRLHFRFNGAMVGDSVAVGGEQIGVTDADGRISFQLMRGQLVSVAIPGTNVVRDITVPTDPAVKTFNLLDPSIAGEDVFKVVVPNLVYADRRTL